ncbi:leucine-rich repeat protein [uncultured Eubacterium sp.]|uniref:leucine-rich repeat protein n=1 Tax=uncultured Eubacterium sp. TaxID=165185 RepID=UPI002805E94A|nr:leucine-rich repeat protein [uncultured Eubacterium sp.]
MRKFISIFISFAMALSIVFGFSFSASASVSNGKCGADVTYSFDKTNGVLTFSGSGEINDYSYSNNSPFYRNTDIKTIKIGTGITTIGNELFSGCSSLTEVTIPDSVIRIGKSAFKGCSSLSSVYIPNSVTSMGDYIFENCKGLLNIIIPDSVTSIGVRAFDNCSMLKSAVIGSGVTSIGSYAFYNCVNLADVTMGDNVKQIGNYSFGYCKVLKSIELPNSLNTIGKSAFSECKSLTSISLPNTVTSLGENAFYNCNALTSATLSDSLTSIEPTSFASCVNLTNVVVPKSVTNIENYAFTYCTRLVSVTIPKGIKTIGKNAFANCKSLKDLYYLGNEKQWNDNVSNDFKTWVSTNNITLHFSVDTDALDYLKTMISEYARNDYSDDTYTALLNKLENVPDDLSNLTQQEVDSFTTSLLESMYDLKPYLNLSITAPNGTFTVEYDNNSNVQSKASVLSGTTVTLTAVPNDGYKFVGWYDTVNNLYFSKDSKYTFKIVANTDLKAVFVKNNSATLTFTTYTNWVKSTVTKTVDEWQSVTSIAELVPEVPYRYGYINGRWAFDEAEVLAKLQAGEDVFVVAEYDKGGTELPTPPVVENSVLALELHYNYDDVNQTASFLMGVGIPENCNVESLGILYYYKEAESFDPTNFTLLINNKMTAGKYNAGKSSGLCIANIRNFTSEYNWAVRGYISYYDAENNLVTVYSNQINVINRQQV